MLPHRRLDILPHREAREQRALLEQHAPALADQQTFLVRQGVEVVPEHLDRPGPLVNEPENCPREDRLAGPRRADEAEHLAAVEVEIEPVHHEPVAEADLEPADADDHLPFGAGGRKVGQ